LKTPGGASRSDARARDFGRGKEIQIQIRPGGISRQGGCGVTISEYEKGQVVFAQGDPADSVFYIRESLSDPLAEMNFFWRSTKAHSGFMTAEHRRCAC
jgi:hypothetical protein